MKKNVEYDNIKLEKCSTVIMSNAYTIYTINAIYDKIEPIENNSIGLDNSIITLDVGGLCYTSRKAAEKSLMYLKNAVKENSDMYIHKIDGYKFFDFMIFTMELREQPWTFAGV